MATAKTEFDENAMKFRERFIEERKKKGYIAVFGKRREIIQN